MVKLVVYQNDSIIAEYEFDPSVHSEHEIYVGRAEDCHLKIANQQVSRYHLSLTYSDGILALKKLSQYESVFVNGKNVGHALISDTDMISFYDFQVRVSGIDGVEVRKEASLVPETREQSSEIVVKEEDEKKIETEDLTLENFTSSDLSPLGEGLEEKPFESEEDKKEEITEFRVDLPSGTSSDIYNESVTVKMDTIGEDEASMSIEEQIGDQTEDFNIEEGEDILEFSELDATGANQELTPFEATEERGDSTQVYENFVQFYLNIFGDGIPYQRYLIDQNEIVIGRSKAKCQIVIDDDDVSSIHARVLIDRARVVLEDLGSANGTLFNGEKVNKVNLEDRDRFSLGGVTFELRVSSEMLKEENKILMPIESEQEVIREEVVEVDDLGEISDFQEERPEALLARVKYDFDSAMKNPKKKRIFMIAGILLLFLILVPDPEEPVGEKQSSAGNVAQKKEEPSNRSVKKEVVPENRSQEELEYLETHYLIAKSKLEEGDYSNALYELDLVRTVNANYKETEQLVALAKEGLRRIEEEERKQKEEQEKLRIEGEIKKLLAKAEGAHSKGQLELAQTYLNQIAEYDPEHSALAALKIEIETAKKEQEKLKREEEKRENARKAFIAKLTPAKKYIADRKWSKALKILEELLLKKDIDKALMDEATSLYQSTQNTMTERSESLLVEAEKFKQGQDLKNAYEAYIKVLKVNPHNSLAHKEVGAIKGKLNQRAKMVFREALVSESISLFDDAKEKFLEVLQIAPSDSEYYKKADAKLKEFYLE